MLIKIFISWFLTQIKRLAESNIILTLIKTGKRILQRENALYSLENAKMTCNKLILSQNFNVSKRTCRYFFYVSKHFFSKTLSCGHVDLLKPATNLLP